MNTENEILFQPFSFKNGITVKNRVAMAPMTTWASNDDYTVSDDEIKHYSTRVSGPGLVITGCTRVSANGIGFSHEFASYNDSFIPSLKKLAEAAKSGGASAILQIYHAGNKAIHELIANGGLVSASAVAVGTTPFSDGTAIPRSLTHGEIMDIIAAFGQATRRAIEAGFDGVEIHGAHGFLLQNFFSPTYNKRNDQWGGSADNRMKFPLEVVREVKKVINELANRPFLLGYRISPEEPQEGSYKIKDIYPLIDKLIELEIDYLHVSLTNVIESRPIGKEDGETIATLILEHVNDSIPVIAAGQIKTPEQADQAIKLGLSLVAIGQALIINPNWISIAQKRGKVEEALSISKLPELSIPEKLWGIIDTAKGWFRVAD
jgi:2,4-dienoyl-CoA reductase-like NADH-dependent reductase (Old Yellow Enzyme family)